MTPFRSVRILSIAVALSSTGAAQEIGRIGEGGAWSPDTLSRRNLVATSLDKNLNTYNWSGLLNVDTVFAGTQVFLRQIYTANIILQEMIPGVKQSLSSNQEQLSLGLRRWVGQDLGIRAHWSSLVFSDDKAVGLSNASGHSLLGGIDFQPLPFLTLTPLLGYRWDNQGEIRERGPSYTLGAELRQVESEGYRFTGGGQIHQDLLDQRTLGNHYGRLGVEKSFSGRSRDSLELGYYRLRREFYSLTDSTIESRQDNLFSVTNLLEYQVERNVLATLYVSVASRELNKDIRAMPGAPERPDRFDTRIEEFRLDATAQVDFAPPGPDDLGGYLRMGFTERDERHRAIEPETLTPALEVLFNQRSRQEESKDNLAKRTSLSGFLSAPLSRSDRMTLSGGASILRYDTPSLQNVEERDELLVAALVATDHRVSSVLDLGVRLEGTMTHVVYLLKERSANNNINRVLRLAPRTLFRPSRWFTTANAFEVLANYTVYDFEEQVASVRSFSYRQFSWLDSTVIQLTGRIGLHLSIFLKLYERGQLNWDEFEERPENAFADETLGLQLRFAAGAGTVFALGWQYFSQSRYAFEGGERVLSGFQRSTGPMCALIYDAAARGRVYFRGWLEHRRQMDGTSRLFTSMTLTASWNF
jgi:hypothetical protein